MDHQIEVGGIHVVVTPWGMWHYGNEYLRAADTCPVNTIFSPVPYFLVCHGLELLLKAFILAKRVPPLVPTLGLNATASVVKPLKSTVGHNLEKALAEAKAEGVTNLVPFEPEDEAEILKANEYYDDKVFEYFYVVRAATGYQNLPDLDRLKKLATRLLPKVEELCKTR